MQTHITCECGNKVAVSDEQAKTGIRCPRCGRQVGGEDDIQHLIDDNYLQPISEDIGSRAGSHVQSSNVSVPVDPDATVVRTVALAGNNKTGSGTPTVSADDFDINYPPTKDSSITTPSNVRDSKDGSQSSKYDLSQRVMRPIARPVAPVIPYSGVGEYGIHRILRLLQRGGMGRILVAYDQYLKREVAIKELHPDVAEDESIVRRFIGEAEITAQLEHPGVVPIYRLGQVEDGLPYYTMKMIRGETLQDLIKAYHRKPSQPELLNLIRRLVSVSKTIAFAHNKGVIHRDLKPTNVMVGEYGETLVMDWGLAKPYNQGIEESYVSIIHRTKQSRPELTMVGAIVGTPAFMSPEQAMAEDSMVGPLSDVFSLGTVLYYLLVGQTAFSGRSTQEVLNKVRACNPTPPSQIKPNVPRGLEAICLKAMEKLPENRYQGATEFADDLCRWLDDEPIAAEHPSPWSKIRWWAARHSFWAMGVPSVLLLSMVLSLVGAWLIQLSTNSTGQNQSNAVEKVGYEQTVPTEFRKPIRIDGSRGIKVWEKTQHSGELLLSCHVKPSESEGPHVVSVCASNAEPWDLSERLFLTFSLLEVHSGSNVSLQNFSIRLGCEDAYYEYKPSESLWERRDQVGWSHFTIPLQGHHDDWRREIIGEPAMKKIERVEIHFESDSEMTLIFANVKFRGE